MAPIITQDVVDQIFGDLTLGGGIDQADLMIKIMEQAQKMAATQHEVGLGLIQFIRDDMADPFNILTATSLFGQAGGSALSLSDTGVGAPSQFGPLFDQIMEAVSQFALGDFPLPSLPGQDPGGPDPAIKLDPAATQLFSLDEFNSRLHNFDNLTSTDATWMLQFADHWGALNQNREIADQARRVSDVILRRNSGQITSEEAREELQGGGAPVPGARPEGTPGLDFDLDTISSFLKAIPDRLRNGTTTSRDQTMALQLADSQLIQSQPRLGQLLRNLADIIRNLEAQIISPLEAFQQYQQQAGTLDQAGQQGGLGFERTPTDPMGIPLDATPADLSTFTDEILGNLSGQNVPLVEQPRTVL